MCNLKMLGLSFKHTGRGRHFPLTVRALAAGSWVRILPLDRQEAGVLGSPLAPWLAFRHRCRAQQRPHLKVLPHHLLITSFQVNYFHVSECWLPHLMGFPGGSDGKEPVCNAGDLSSIPGLGRLPGEGSGYPLQYSCLENSMDKGTWGATVHMVTKSRTWLSWATNNLPHLID